VFVGQNDAQRKRCKSVFSKKLNFFEQLQDLLFKEFSILAHSFYKDDLKTVRTKRKLYCKFLYIGEFIHYTSFHQLLFDDYKVLYDFGRLISGILFIVRDCFTKLKADTVQVFI